MAPISLNSFPNLPPPPPTLPNPKKRRNNDDDDDVDDDDVDDDNGSRKRRRGNWGTSLQIRGEKGRSSTAGSHLGVRRSKRLNEQRKERDS